MKSGENAQDLRNSKFTRISSLGQTGSAISVVNAIAAGKGSTIGIEMKCLVSAFIKKYEKEKIVVSSKGLDHHGLVLISTKLALSRSRLRIPRGSSLQIKVESEIPQAVGLKSSSAVSTAVVEAVFSLKDYFNPQTILETSCAASKLSGASLTGAYDDAAACLLGGLVLSDNAKYKMIHHKRVPKDLGSFVAIWIPRDGKKFTSDVKRSSYSDLKREALRAFDYALKGEVSSAMLLNSMVQCAALGYSFTPVSSAISAGASAAGISGKGPAVSALCARSKQLDRVEKAWKDLKQDGRVLTTRIVQPKRLLEE